MKKQFLLLMTLFLLGTTMPATAQTFEEDETYMNWAYASGIDKPRPQTIDTSLQRDVSQVSGGNYTYDNYYTQMQTTDTSLTAMNAGMMGGTATMGGMETMNMGMSGIGMPMMTGPVLTQISPAQAQAQANGSVQYMNNPVKVQYPITKQFPVSVQYPVTVQRDITVNRPVVMQQPVVVQRPVVMQQPVMVQHQPMMVQQQPIYMQQQPTYLQQQPVVVQAGGGAAVHSMPAYSMTGGAAMHSMPAYSITGYAVESAETYPAAYTIGN